MTWVMVATAFLSQSQKSSQRSSPSRCSVPCCRGGLHARRARLTLLQSEPPALQRVDGHAWPRRGSCMLKVDAWALPALLLRVAEPRRLEHDRRAVRGDVHRRILRAGRVGVGDVLARGVGGAQAKGAFSVLLPDGGAVPTEPVIFWMALATCWGWLCCFLLSR